MANEKRKRQIAVGGLIEDNPLTSGATTLTSAGLSAVIGGVASTEHLAVVLDPDGTYGAPEIAYVTTLTDGGTSGTVARGQEGTTAREHLRDVPWIHAATLRDYLKMCKAVRDGGGTVTITSTTRTPVDSTNLPFVYFDCEVGDIVECQFAFGANVTGGGNGYVDVEVDRPTSANTYVANANDDGIAAWRNVAGPVHAVGVFTITERGRHGFRPVAFRSGGTSVQLENAASGTADTPITFIAKNLGPESA
jgi:hypothetical protein